MPIILFKSIHYVLLAEKLLKEHNVKIDLRPAPRFFSSSCGMCIAIEKEDLDLVKEILEKQNIDFEIEKI